MLALVVAIVAVAGAYISFRTSRAAEHARTGRNALLDVEAALEQLDPEAAGLAVDRADRAFASMDDEIGALGPLRSIGRSIPLIRVNVRAVEAVAHAGGLVTDSADSLVAAVAALMDPANPELQVAQAVTGLEDVRTSLDQALGPLEEALTATAKIEGTRLLGPLDDARAVLRQRLPEALASARDAERSIEALIRFAGGGGPRRYLILSQNPDEIRPTGGFIGTYGVMSTDGSRLELERYDPIQRWPALDTAIVPAAEAPTPFRIPEPDHVQQLANVNATSSWREAAVLAERLWTEGGEAPIDAVIGITPEVLARLVGVVGSVEVPTYRETVTAANLIDRVDFYAHRAGLTAHRKQFIADLARVVLDTVLDAPPRQWIEIGRALGASLDAREAMVWSSDEAVAEVVEERQWDGELPAADGDFFHVGEFAYANKNGRALRRTFDHHVSIRPDGSARIVTRITTKNTRPPSEVDGEKLNVDAVRYAVVVGPRGATLAEGTTSPIAEEQPVAGHPAFGFEATGPPLEESSFTVAWEAPSLVEVVDDRAAYRLTWLRIPAHRGDVLRLRVDLPDGWEWAADAPPDSFRLVADVREEWPISVKNP